MFHSIMTALLTTAEVDATKGTRTLISEDTRLSNVPVYQFQHGRVIRDLRV